ncbi:hypothetical protein BG011_004801, partial [Mortierella polycephala]
FDVVNSVYFSTRTKSLNNILYWGAQIIGSWAIARLLDYQGTTRKIRSLWALAVISTCFISTWIGGYFFQKGFTVNDPNGDHDFQEGGSYIGPLILYIFYGLNDAAWQTYCYWLMGSLSNDVTVLSRYAGFYKGIQSAGAAIAWRLSAVSTPYMTQYIICFVLLVASLPGALALSMRIEDRLDFDAPDSDIHASEEKHQGKHEADV